jgi:hypothetical protein
MSLTIRLRHYIMRSEDKAVPSEALGQSHVDAIFIEGSLPHLQTIYDSLLLKGTKHTYVFKKIS